MYVLPMYLVSKLFGATFARYPNFNSPNTTTANSDKQKGTCISRFSGHVSRFACWREKRGFAGETLRQREEERIVSSRFMSFI